MNHKEERENEAFENVSAKRFTLVDNDGKVCATLGTGVDGGPCLEFRDFQGKIRARFFVVNLRKPDESLPRLELLDKEGNLRVALDTDAAGTPVVSFFDHHKNHVRAQLFLREDGTPALEFHDKDSKVIWSAP